MTSNWTPQIYNSHSLVLPHATAKQSFNPDGHMIIDRVEFIFKPYNRFYRVLYWLFEKANYIATRGTFTISIGLNNLYYSYNMELCNWHKEKFNNPMTYEHKERFDPGNEIRIEFKNNSNTLAFMYVIIRGCRSLERQQ